MDSYADGRFAEGWQFERFVAELLSRMYEIPAAESERDQAADLGIDIRTLHGSQPIFVEVRAQTPQTNRRLSDMITQLKTRNCQDLWINSSGVDHFVIGW
jgi:hypothetical protein